LSISLSVSPPGYPRNDMFDVYQLL